MNVLCYAGKITKRTPILKVFLVKVQGHVNLEKIFNGDQKIVPFSHDCL